MSVELSSILVQAGKITAEQAESARKLAETDGSKFEAALVKMGVVRSED